MRKPGKGLSLLALCAAVSLSGCGGNGGSGAAGSSASRAAVYITDSFREEFGHVWATIYHVELVPQGGGAAVVLFDDAAGLQIDLKTLRDAAGARYSFLGNATIPAGVYTGVNVTIGESMQLFRHGVAVGDPIAVDASLPRDASGHPITTVTFRTPKSLSTGAVNLILDFDLARFVLRNSQVLPALAEGDGAGLHDPAHHERCDYRGTVSGLAGTAPDLTFTLTRPDGSTLAVATTASTALFGSALADGAAVEVTGTVDPTSGTLIATQVQVREAGAPSRPARVVGAASALDAGAGTFTLSTLQARGFVPGQTAVQVVTNAATRLRNDAGESVTAAEFFTALAATPSALVEGVYDAATNTLTATLAKVADPARERGWLGGPHPFRGDRDRWGNDALRRRDD